jgi:hypothetical protein
MNNKPNLPESVQPGEYYSLWIDLKVNGWMLVAILLSIVSDMFFPGEIKTWQPAWQAIIAIAPFPAILLWVRDLTRWIGGMDELHRRITLTAIVFAVSATLFVLALWHLLVRAGIWQTLFQQFFDFNSVWVILSLITALYFHGYRIFNRRYQ